MESTHIWQEQHVGLGQDHGLGTGQQVGSSGCLWGGCWPRALLLTSAESTDQSRDLFLEPESQRKSFGLEIRCES